MKDRSEEVKFIPLPKKRREKTCWVWGLTYQRNKYRRHAEDLNKNAN
jgi:hypothetical protein